MQKIIRECWLKGLPRANGQVSSKILFFETSGIIDVVFWKSNAEELITEIREVVCSPSRYIDKLLDQNRTLSVGKAKLCNTIVGSSQFPLQMF